MKYFVPISVIKLKQILHSISISLIIHGCSTVYYLIWPKNHTSHKKFYFNEFVANVMPDVIGIVIFDLRGHGGHKRPKTPLRGQKWHEGVDLLKKVINENCSATSKTPWRLQSDLSYDLRQERYMSDLWGHSMYIATRRARLEAREAGFLVW